MESLARGAVFVALEPQKAIEDTGDKVMLADLRSVDSGPSDDELEKARMRQGWESRQVLDDADGLADFHGLSVLAGIADTVDARHREILAVTREQVRDVARRIFRADNVNGVAVGLLEEPHKKELEQIVKSFSELGAPN